MGKNQIPDKNEREQTEEPHVGPGTAPRPKQVSRMGEIFVTTLRVRTGERGTRQTR